MSSYECAQYFSMPCNMLSYSEPLRTDDLDVEDVLLMTSYRVFA